MKILHLYYDLMNLYGDYANLLALSKILKENDIEHTIDKLSVFDEINLFDYDLVYIGSGTEKNQKTALAHLLKYKDDVCRYIEEGRFMLLTGNSFEMLGHSINSFLGEYEGLDVLPFTVTEQNTTRNTADCIMECEFTDKPIVGFINKCSEIHGICHHLFVSLMGLADNPDVKTEGIHYNNLYATHLTGPILVKNPHFLRAFASALAGKELLADSFEYEKRGFEITYEKLRERNAK